MFIDELTPIFKQVIQHPVSFMGGFVSGLLRLNLKDEPVKSWLAQNMGSTTYSSPSIVVGNGRADGGPQSIKID